MSPHLQQRHEVVCKSCSPCALQKLARTYKSASPGEKEKKGANASVPANPLNSLLLTCSECIPLSCLNRAAYLHAEENSLRPPDEHVLRLQQRDFNCTAARGDAKKAQVSSAIYIRRGEVHTCMHARAAAHHRCGAAAAARYCTSSTGALTFAILHRARDRLIMNAL